MPVSMKRRTSNPTESPARQTLGLALRLLCAATGLAAGAAAHGHEHQRGSTAAHTRAEDVGASAADGASGSASVDYEPYDPPPYAYAVLAGCVAIALIAGAFLANSRLQLTSWGQFLYHKTLAPPPRRRAWRRLLGPVAELTYGEAAALLLFFGTCAAYGVYYYENAMIPHPMARTAHAFAGVGYVTMAAALLPVSRNSLWLRALGLPLERALKYHRWTAELFVFAIWAHGLLVALYVAAVAKAPAGSDSPLLQWWPYVVPGAGLWLVDKAWRIWDSRCRGTRLLSLSLVGGLVRLEAAKREFSVRRPGQYIFLCVPSIAPLQWHPFSLSSAPAPCLAGTEGRFTLHIRPLAPHTFTGHLKALAERPAGEPLPEILVEGPYGRVSVDLTVQETVVLVAGGVGVTPMLSTLGYLAAARPAALRRVRFCWTVQDESPLEATGGALRAAAAALASAGVECDISVHCTRPRAKGGQAPARAEDAVPPRIVKVVDLSAQAPVPVPLSKAPSRKGPVPPVLSLASFAVAPLERLGSALVRAGSGFAHAGSGIVHAIARMGSAALPIPEDAFEGEDPSSTRSSSASGDSSEGEGGGEARAAGPRLKAPARLGSGALVSADSAAGALSRSRCNSALRRRGSVHRAAPEGEPLIEELPTPRLESVPAVSMLSLVPGGPVSSHDVAAALARVDLDLLSDSSSSNREGPAAASLDLATPAAKPFYPPTAGKGTEADPVRVLHGRPVLPEVMAAARDATRAPFMAVLTCGPTALMADAERAARGAEDGRLAVHFHRETFQF
eukprot:tig00000057_g106.t1